MSNILFILKEQQKNAEYSCQKNTGLFNSCNFLIEILNNIGFTASLEFAIDGNDIERLVVNNSPDIVILEALWVTPDKVVELSNIYSDIDWIVRVHSDIPFLSSEGIAIEWILNYMKNKNIYIAFNNEKTFKYFFSLLKFNENCLFLPNWYPLKRINNIPNKYMGKNGGIINIGCFGAIRPLKNQLLQACAAISYADKYGLKLKFHMNATRIENNGFNVLKNIRSLFNNLDSNYELYEHEWESHVEFLKTIDEMDLGMQVSFSETFNIVSADFVSRNKPIVVSDEIEWVDTLCRVKIIDVEHIMSTMYDRLNSDFLKLTKINTLNLADYNNRSENIWLETFGD